MWPSCSASATTLCTVIDAEAAARAAQAGRAGGVPKTRGGKVDALRALRVARRSTDSCWWRPAPMPSARSRR